LGIGCGRRGHGKEERNRGEEERENNVATFGKPGGMQISDIHTNHQNITIKKRRTP
jgi:hypothetical protein